MPPLRALFTLLAAIGLFSGTTFLILHPAILEKSMLVIQKRPDAQDIESPATAVTSDITKDAIAPIATTPGPKKESPDAPPPPENAPLRPDENSKTKIHEPEPLYAHPTLSVEELNKQARAALVNILCEAVGPIRSTSGSGVIIDPRGIILTNAHVAQYFLLEASPDFPVTCSIRSGSPARSVWKAELIFIPQAWVEEHAADIVETKPMGTGEHDYALLAITETINGSHRPSSFPFVPMDTREAIGKTGDAVFSAAYPAEFIGGVAARNDLNAVTTIAQVKQLLTFTDKLVDALSLGGTALAQSGSSGGAVLNMWGYMVGLMVTTSEGDTTATRDLRAATLSHVNRSIRQHTEQSLVDFLEPNLDTLILGFHVNHAPSLSKTLMSAITEKRL